MEKLLFEISTAGKKGIEWREEIYPEKGAPYFLLKNYLRKSPPRLPEVTEAEVVLVAVDATGRPIPVLPAAGGAA